jgi:hypothetical protein
MPDAPVTRGPLGSFAVQHVRRVAAGLSGLSRSLGWAVRCDQICRRELRRSLTIGPHALDLIFRDNID